MEKIEKSKANECDGKKGWIASIQHIVWEESCPVVNTGNTVVCEYTLIIDQTHLIDLEDLDRESVWELDFSSLAQLRIARREPFKRISFPFPQDETGFNGLFFCGCGSKEVDCGDCCIRCCDIALEIAKKFE